MTVLVFWLSLGFLAYTFVGYPALVFLLATIRRLEQRRQQLVPRVSILITAYNEENRLRNKIVNTLALTYSAGQLEIIIASDGSTDSTCKIVRSFADRGVRLLELRERHGKNHALMQARDLANGEILVFTDVAVELQNDAIQNIVSNFADPSVACVSSEDRVLPVESGESGEASYVSFEMWLRRMESLAGSLITLSGSFFAARREACDPWHPDQSNDFFVALHAIERHQRAVLDSRSLGYYRLTHSSGAEFQRKVRTIVNGMHVLFAHSKLLNPFKYPMAAWQLLSHKLCRWSVPFALLLMSISSAALAKHSLLYPIFLSLQIFGYGCGLAAILWPGLMKIRIFRATGFLIVGSAATIVAWFRYATGERFVMWQPTQRPEASKSI